MVVLARRSPLHQFVIQAIKNAAPRASVRVAADEAGSQAKQLSVAVPDNPPRLRHRAMGWLARIAGLEAHHPPSEPTVVTRQAAPTTSLTTYDAKQYNWSSFFCPYCDATGFVKCSSGHLACDGTVQIRSGSRFHQCFCGNAGFISGTIESFNGRQSIRRIRFYGKFSRRTVCAN
jgi:hypothetical protein